MSLLLLDSTDPAAPERAAEAAIRLPRGAPVVALVHGYRYGPGIPGLCPRESLYAADGWPGRLQLGEDALVIGFGWDSRGSIWQAWSAAARAGAQLARLLAALDRPVDALAHSLGARVALTATALAPAGRAGRLILLAAAAFRGDAQAVLSTPGGAAAEIFNVTSRENALYDSLLATAIRPRQGPPLGAGLGEWRRNWLDIAIDSAATRSALARLGFPIPAPDRRFCHWSSYTRRGLFPFYRALLAERQTLPLQLIAGLLPDSDPPGTDRLGPGLLPSLS